MSVHYSHARTLSLSSGREIVLVCGRGFHICTGVARTILVSPGRPRRTGRFTASTPAAKGCWLEWQRACRTLGRVRTRVCVIGRVAYDTVWVPGPFRAVGRRGSGRVAGELCGDKARGAR